MLVVLERRPVAAPHPADLGKGGRDDVTGNDHARADIASIGERSAFRRQYQRAALAHPDIRVLDGVDVDRIAVGVLRIAGAAGHRAAVEGRRVVGGHREVVIGPEIIDELHKRVQRRAVIEKRTDDKDPRVLRTRMEVYQKDTSKLLKHYPERLISRFDADQKPLEVLRDVLVGLSELLSK